MQSQATKLILAVLITTIIVGGGTYYFLHNEKLDYSTSPVTNKKQENIVFNQSSKEYAVMGKEVWSAFQCSSWASKNNDPKEAERLFLFGYEQGKIFISALAAQKIKQEDLSQEVPIGVTMLLQGPSEEFILGRIHSAAEEEALKEVFETDNKYNPDEMQKIIAGNKFRDGNCQLIGK